MVAQVKDIPQDQKDTLAHRLTRARTEARLSRPQLGKMTGIPHRTIERFEYGTSDPSTSRLKSLSEALGVSVEWLLNGDGDGNPTQEYLAPDVPRQPEVANDAGEEDAMQSVLCGLDELDGFRMDGFENGRRRSMALIDSLMSVLKYLEPEELVELAEERGVYRGECPTSFNLLDIFRENPEEAQRFCGLIEERIMDTAILGVDLYALELKTVSDLGKGMEEVDTPFFGWDDHQEAVPAIRDVLRRQAIAGHGLNFDDRKAFPRRR